MPKALITGMNGTLAPYFATQCTALGYEVVPWDRQSVSPDDGAAGWAFLEDTHPDIVCHLGMGSEGWAEGLAAWCAQRSRPMLFTSSAMVFDHHPDGPHGVMDTVNAQDDYGQYKIRCEHHVLWTNPQALVLRIGWQIGLKRGGNNLLEHCFHAVETTGRIEASRRWIPACSFMDDTARIALDLLREGAAGVHQLDGNRETAWSFDVLCRALGNHHGQAWPIKVTEDYVHDQRLLDDRVPACNLSSRLSL